MARRGARAPTDASRPHHFLVEAERTGLGEIVPVAAVFLTNRECPWRCLMCDLWRHTTAEPVPPGAIPAQIDYALERFGPLQPRQIKLYNSGSFFDAKAVPPADDAAIAERVRRFERVIVESHPRLVGERCLRFRDLLGSGGRGATLEVAMGLETAHPVVLEKLNKRMTLEDFSGAAAFLKKHGIALRAFVLVKPPFLDEDEALHWACRSVDAAFDCGAEVVCLIPVRGGNGGLEALAEQGDFSPPRLATLEAAAGYGIGLGRGRVFADLWDLKLFATCQVCLGEREERLRRMNRSQAPCPRSPCPQCGE